MRMIILAAGQGTRLSPLTDDRPKCLVKLAGRPLLEWQIDAAKASGIDDIVVIGGYRADQIAKYPVRLLTNPKFSTTNMVRTLFCAQDLFNDGFVVSYGDIVYTPQVLEKLLHSKDGISVVVDKAWRAYWKERSDSPLDDAESLKLNAQGMITEIGQKAGSLDEIEAQYIGLIALRSAGVEALTRTYDEISEADSYGKKPFDGVRTLDQLYMTDLLQGLITKGENLKAVPINRGWVEVDNPHDLKVAEAYVTKNKWELHS